MKSAKDELLLEGIQLFLEYLDLLDQPLSFNNFNESDRYFNYYLLREVDFKKRANIQNSLKRWIFDQIIIDEILVNINTATNSDFREILTPHLRDLKLKIILAKT